MIYRNTSAKAIIANVYRKYGIVHAGWEMDAIENIGIALGLIGHNVATKPVMYEVFPINYKTALPCALEQVIYLEYNGSRLLPLDSKRKLRTDRYKPENTGGSWYFMQPGIINTSFTDKVFYIHANAIELDVEGFPMVPDSSEHMEALSWYVLREMLSAGFKHPVFNWEKADAMWLQWWPRAQNKAVRLDLAGQERFKNIWTGWCKDYRREYRFDFSGKTFDDTAVVNGANTLPVEIIRIDNSSYTDDLELSQDL